MIPNDVIEEAGKMVFAVEKSEIPYWASWEELPEEGRAKFRKMAMAAIVIALPGILAEERAAAWGIGMWTMYNTTSGEWPPIPEQNPFRSAV